MQSIAEGDKLVQKGKNELSRFRIIGDKYQNALKYFQPAINIYKYHKEWDKCAETLILCTECTEEEKAYRYRDIASCYQHFDEDKYVEWTKKMIQLAALDGNFRMMAHAYHKLAELHDQRKDSGNALKYYQQVISLQEIDKYTSAIHNIKQRMAELYIELDNYQEALKLLNEVLEYYSKAGTLIWHIDKILLTIMLVYIDMDDEVMVKRMLAEYGSTYPKFSLSPEYELVENLVAAINEKDKTGFTDRVRKYQCGKQMESVQSVLIDKMDEKFDDMEASSDLC